MSRKQIQFGRRALAAGALCFAAVAGLDLLRSQSPARDPAGPQAAPPEEAAQGVAIFPANAFPIGVKLSAAELRKRFPFVSLGKRLEPETRRQTGAADRPQPMLAEASRKRLEELEKQDGKTSRVRSESLRLLHSDQVEKFISREGFGMTRMIRIEPSPEYLEYPEPQPIPLAASSADDAGESPLASVALPERGMLEESGGAWTPSQEMLNAFHMPNRDVFVAPWSTGYVKDRDHVAGFRSHGFGYLPELNHPENQLLPPEPGEGSEQRYTRPERWKIARLELVSLLTHDEPAVYISSSLPRMKELTQAKTRPLTEFESQALKSLENGEDLVASASTNDIHMLGAVRAAKQCTECHAVKRGELLGAFSYRLKRYPSLNVPPPRTKPSA